MHRPPPSPFPKIRSGASSLLWAAAADVASVGREACPQVLYVQQR
jgi:hypothetical protein